MSNIFTTLKPLIIKHSPEILLSLGIAGVIGTVAGVAVGTNKATKAVESKKKELEVDKLPFKENFKIGYKYYIAPAITLTGAITCLITSNRVSANRQAAIAAAYTISETALQTYQDKVKELTNDSKAAAIKDEVAKETVNKTYEPNNVIITGDGNCLFYEPLTGRYFKSSWNKIQSAANRLNAEALSGMSGVTTLNDWFDALGLDHVSFGYERGWDMSKDYKNIINISPSSSLTEDNTPCGSIDYITRPTDI